MTYLPLALLWIAWCAIHSGMITLTTTEYLKRRLGKGFRFYRLFFNIFAIATALLLFAYTNSLQSPVVFQWQGLLAGVQVSLLAFSGLLFLAGAWQYDLLQFCGIRQILTGSSHHGLSETEKFNTSGILSVTRHPWYLGGILFVWTDDRNLDMASLVMNTILTAYLIVGTILEERKLLKQFGDEYLAYQKSVPMLAPVPWRRAARPTKHDSEDQARGGATTSVVVRSANKRLFAERRATSCDTSCCPNTKQSKIEMTRELSIWGVGPSILIAAGAYAAVAGLATWFWPEVCLVSAIPYPVLQALGILMLAAGFPMLIVGGKAVTRAYGSDELATTGVLGLVRNPIYSAWIVFLIPGLVLFSRSWPLLLTPLVAYVVFKIRIRREDEYLEHHFGDAYRKYRSEVNELIPWKRRPQ